jgi:septal ring factor EnvC (AmiA/AmiB activator)
LKYLTIPQFNTYLSGLLLVLLLSLVAAPYSYAEDSAARLDEIRQEMATISRDEKKLSTKKIKIERHLQTQEEQLHALSKQIQSNELNKNYSLKKIQELTDKEAALAIQFQQRKKDVEKLVFAMIRLKSVPPEIMILQPDGLLSAAQGSMVLGGILPDLEKDIQRLGDDINALNQLKTDIKAQQTDVTEYKKNLENDRKKLARLIEQRKTDLYNTNKDLYRRQLTLSKLSREVRDVEELLAQIAQLKSIPKPKAARRKVTQPTKKEKTISRKEKTRKARSMQSRATPKGISPGMPVVGAIRVSYGQRDDIGANSQGWTISAQGEAIVTAPFDGTIKYTGPFKRYGQIILIEHDGGYFSLIGGVSEIYALPETTIKQGTAIAKMGNVANTSGEVNLYYEVRYKGKAVDPKRLLSSRNL